MFGRFLGGFGVIAFFLFALVGVIVVARTFLSHGSAGGTGAPTRTGASATLSANSLSVQPTVVATPTATLTGGSTATSVRPTPTATPNATAAPPRQATATFVYAQQPSITVTQASLWCYGWPNCDRSRIREGGKYYGSVTILPGPPINFTIPPYYRVVSDGCPALAIPPRLENVFVETTFTICSGEIENYDYRPGR